MAARRATRSGATSRNQENDSLKPKSNSRVTKVKNRKKPVKHSPVTRVLRKSNRQVPASPNASMRSNGKKSVNSSAIASPEVYSFEEFNEEKLSLSMEISPTKLPKIKVQKKNSKIGTAEGTANITDSKCSRGVKRYLENMKRSGAKKTKSSSLLKRNRNNETKRQKVRQTVAVSSYARRNTDMAPTSTPSVQVRSRFKKADVGKHTNTGGLVDSPMLSPVERVSPSGTHGNMVTSQYTDCISPPDFGSPKLDRAKSTEQEDLNVPMPEPRVSPMLFEDVNDVSLTDEGYFTLQRSGPTYSSDGSKLTSPTEPSTVLDKEPLRQKKKSKSKGKTSTASKNQEKKQSNTKVNKVKKQISPEQENKISKINEEFDSIDQMDFYIE